MNAAPKFAIVSGGLNFGGSTSFVLQLALGLQSMGIAPAVFSFRLEQGFSEDFAKAGIPVHISDEKRDIFEDRLSVLYQKIVEFNPTVVIANIGREAYESLRYVPQGVARIGMVHDLAMNPGELVPLYQDILDGVAAVNSHLANLVQSVAPTVMCRSIPHGIPLPEMASPRVPNPNGPLRIIFFGRVEKSKGTRLFPSIVKELHERKVPFQWTIHGEGPDELYLRQQLATEIASRQVVMSAKVPREQLFSIVRQHDIFIMASEVEGGPLTLLEAMSAGLVPICNDIPCIVQEVINPENGIIISREPQRYAESIARLHRDRPLLERLSSAAHQTITANFTLEAMARRYLDFVHSLMPQQQPVVWPKQIAPQPIRGITGVSKLSQSLGAARSARRLLKRFQQ